MGHSYTHLTLEDRCQMAHLQATGHSIRQIAATLDRAPSSIARELKRNASTRQDYRPGYADQQAQTRRWTRLFGKFTVGAWERQAPPRGAVPLAHLPAERRGGGPFTPLRGPVEAVASREPHRRQVRWGAPRRLSRFWGIEPAPGDRSDYRCRETTCWRGALVR